MLYVSRSSRVARNAGFTLVELLVVLAILTLLVGLVGPRMLGQLGGAKSKTAGVQIADLEKSVELFKLGVGRFPSDEEGLEALVKKPASANGWDGPYLKGARCPWTRGTTPTATSVLPTVPMSRSSPMGPMAPRVARVKTPTSAMASSSEGPALRPGLPKARRAFSGFTLLELIVAFAVIALLLGLAPVAFGKLMETSQYRSTVRHMLAGMTAARQMSIQTGQSTVFAVDMEKRVFGPQGKMDQTLPDSVDVRLVIAGLEAGQGGGGIRFLPGGGATGGSVDVLRRSGDGVRLRVDWLLGTVTQEPISR
jgi:type II secretion system protein G